MIIWYSNFGVGTKPSANVDTSPLKFQCEKSLENPLECFEDTQITWKIDEDNTVDHSMVTLSQR